MSTFVNGKKNTWKKTVVTLGPGSLVGEKKRRYEGIYLLNILLYFMKVLQ